MLPVVGALSELSLLQALKETASARMAARRIGFIVLFLLSGVVYDCVLKFFTVMIKMLRNKYEVRRESFDELAGKTL